MEIIETIEEIKDGVVYLTDICYRDETKQEIVWTFTRPKEQPPEPTPVIEDKTVNITREDFDLLDITKANTIYYITEPDNTVTIMRGED